MGILLGKLAPDLIQGLRGLEFGKGSRINGPLRYSTYLAQDHANDDEGGFLLHTQRRTEARQDSRDTAGELGREALLAN